MNKRNMSFGTPGGSALMVIFAVICLIIFAVLSLSTAQADNRLSESSAKAVREYYEADAEANRILALLRSGDTVDMDIEIVGDLYSYSCTISETRTLLVSVRIHGEDIEIVRWQEVYTGDWNPDTSLDVWSGN